MLKKFRNTSVLMDRLHKGFVVTCIAATLFGLTIAGHRTYLYFTVTRPTRDQEELRKLKMNENLKDGNTISS